MMPYPLLTGAWVLMIVAYMPASGTIATCNSAWCNPSAPEPARIASLLATLTLGEKLQQLQTTHTGKQLPGESNSTPTGAIPRLGLEAFTTRECLHGLTELNVTVFPQSISLAATWDRQLLRRVGAAIGAEARGRRNDFDASSQLPNKTLPPPGLACFSPQINIARDPRWGMMLLQRQRFLWGSIDHYFRVGFSAGRAQETYGESPRLTGALAKEYVAGLQGNHPRYVQVVATPKHFDAYGGATSRGHRSPTEVTLSWRDLHETFQPQFRAVLSPSNNSDRNVALSTMCSYNTLCVVDFYNQSCSGPSHGVPACADSALLTALLRDTWNFTGYVISDAGAIKFIETDHEWASSQPIAAAEALKAGADMALGGGCSPSNSPPGCISFGALGNATTMGLITIGDIDQALSRVLRARFRLGLMDPGGGIENPYTAIKPSIVDCSEHRALALQAARESVVLLENPIGFLPLLPKPGLRVAIVGPNANVTLFGNYNGDNANFTTILAGIRRVAPLGGYALGCGISSNSTAGFAEAIAVAEAADVVVMAIGIDQSQEHETGTRNAIELPGVQAKLVQEIHSTGRPVVVVLAGGSAMAVPWVKNFATATVWAGYGGEEAGTAIAEVLFGLAAPSGKLPITFYAETGQLPPFSSYDMARTPGRTFRYLTEQPLWAFGHGLSYTRFEYSGLEFSSKRDEACQSINISASLSNVGGWPGAADEIVMVYAQINASDPQLDVLPRIDLVGFERVRALLPGKVARISFSVEPSQLALVDATDRRGWVVPIGIARLWIGTRQPTLAETVSGVVGATGGLLTAIVQLGGSHAVPLSNCV